MSCEVNELIIRVILLILKYLLEFKNYEFIETSLVQVLGPDVVDAFYKDFCVNVGQEDFGNSILRCSFKPSLMIMPKLQLRESLDFTFTFYDLYGVTYVELVDRINSQVDRDVAV